jgi:phosphatidylserine synthase
MEDYGKTTYRQLWNQQYHVSKSSYVVRRFSTYAAYLLRKLPLTPNMFTVVQVGITLAGVTALLLWESKATFIAAVMAAYVLDQMDGIWARWRGATNAWGDFIDAFTDAVQYFMIDLGLILFCFDRLLVIVGDPRLLTALIAYHFASKELYAASIPPGRPYSFSKDFRALPVGWTGSTMRHFVLFPVVVLTGWLVVPYFAASMLMHTYKVVIHVVWRYRLHSSVPAA